MLARFAKQPRVAFLIASFAHVAGTARAFAGLCVARRTVFAFAFLRAVFAEPVHRTRPIASGALPADRAETLAGFGAAAGAVFAFALLGAVLAVGAVGADGFAAVAVEAGRTGAGSWMGCALGFRLCGLAKYVV